MQRTKLNSLIRRLVRALSAHPAVLAAGLLCMASTASATEFAVNSDADTPLPAGNSVCSTTPGATEPGECTLRAALSLARSGDSVRIASNISLIKLENGQLRIRDASVNVYGVESTRTTIDAQSASRGLLIDSFTGVTNGVVELHNLNFVNGNVVGDGGGVLVSNGYNGFGITTLRLENVRMSNNQAMNGGGVSVGGNGSDTAIEVRNSEFLGNHANVLESQGGFGGAIAANTISVASSSFSKNTASESGGAIYNSNTLTAVDSTFDGNQAQAGNGGAFRSNRAMLQRVTVAANQAGGSGGGIAIAGEGTLIFVGGSVAGNSAAASGGGLYTGSTASCSMLGVAIEGNQANISGGGWAADYVRGIFANGSISDNVLNNGLRGTVGGAGVYAQLGHSANGSTLLFSNATIAKNRIANPASNVSGGGVKIAGQGTATFNHVTIADNNLYKGAGAGIFGSLQEQGAGPTINLSNSIVTRNEGRTNCDSNADAFADASPIFSRGYNAVGSNCPTDQVGDVSSEDAGLDPAGLGNNGGATKTIALLEASVAVDAANPTQRSESASIDTAEAEREDQRGVARPVFGRTALRSDIGAYEFQPSSNVSVQKQSSANPVVGEVMSYTITVTNNGPNTARDVTVTDDVPASLSNLQFEISQGSCGRTGQVISCTIGSIAAGETVTLRITATPTEAGRLANTATITTTNDPNSNDNQSTDVTTVAEAPSNTPTPTTTGAPQTGTSEVVAPGAAVTAPVIGSFTGGGLAGRPGCAATQDSDGVVWMSVVGLAFLRAASRRRR